MKRLTVIDKNLEAWRPQLELSDPVIYKKERIFVNITLKKRQNQITLSLTYNYMLLLD